MIFKMGMDLTKAQIRSKLITVRDTLLPKIILAAQALRAEGKRLHTPHLFDDMDEPAVGEEALPTKLQRKFGPQFSWNQLLTRAGLSLSTKLPFNIKIDHVKLSKNRGEGIVFRARFKTSVGLEEIALYRGNPGGEYLEHSWKERTL